MSYEYIFIDHTADIAVEVKGDSIEELFVASALSWQESTIDKREIKLLDEKEINVEELSYEELLVHFLDELNFLLLSMKWIMGQIKKIEIKKNGDGIKLKAFVTGENIDFNKHHLKVEIKAVTFHQMEIKKSDNKYFTRIVFDI